MKLVGFQFQPSVLLLPFLTLFLLFISQSAAQRQVWSCNSVNGVKTTETASAQLGTISDGPGGVRSNTWCEWLVQPPASAGSGRPRRVKLQFRSFQMMSGEDFVWIFDDAVSQTVPIQRLTGTYMPGVIHSASEAGFRVEFRSSEFGVGNAVAEEQGFELDFTVVEVKGVCNPNPCAAEATCIEDETGAHRCSRCPLGYTGDSSRPGGCQRIVPCPQPIVRKDLRNLSPQERDLFFFALEEMHKSGVYAEMMWIHADKVNFNYAHFTDGFLPWHRQYLMMMEEAIHSVSPECNCIGIPFWDWTMDAADPTRSFVFTDDWFGGNGVDLGDGKKCVRSGRFTWPILGDNCLQRDLNGAGFFATREEVLNAIASNDRFRDFSRAIELFHDTVHRFIGGTMVLDNSADEPLFLVHHSFIDMIWSMWQDCHDYDMIPPASVRSNTNAFTGGIETGSLGTPVDTDYLSPMTFRLAHRDDQVAPIQMHDWRSLGYEYDNLHILSNPMSIEWFDPRWTTCTIENVESFKADPEQFTQQAAAAQNGGFQALEAAPVKLYSGPTMGPDMVCLKPHLNFTNMCHNLNSWSDYELRYVAKLQPTCQRQDLLYCLQWREQHPEWKKHIGMH